MSSPSLSNKEFAIQFADTLCPNSSHFLDQYAYRQHSWVRYLTLDVATSAISVVSTPLGLSLWQQAEMSMSNHSFTAGCIGAATTLLTIFMSEDAALQIQMLPHISINQFPDIARIDLEEGVITMESSFLDTMNPMPALIALFKHLASSDLEITLSDEEVLSGANRVRVKIAQGELDCRRLPFVDVFTAHQVQRIASVERYKDPYDLGEMLVAHLGFCPSTKSKFDIQARKSLWVAALYAAAKRRASSLKPILDTVNSKPEEERVEAFRKALSEMKFNPRTKSHLIASFEGLTIASRRRNNGLSVAYDDTTPSLFQRTQADRDYVASLSVLTNSQMFVIEQIVKKYTKLAESYLFQSDGTPSTQEIPIEQYNLIVQFLETMGDITPTAPLIEICQPAINNIVRSQKGIVLPDRWLDLEKFCESLLMFAIVKHKLWGTLKGMEEGILAWSLTTIRAEQVEKCVRDKVEFPFKDHPLTTAFINQLQMNFDAKRRISRMPHDEIVFTDSYGTWMHKTNG